MSEARLVTWWMWLVCASLGSVISVAATMLVDAIATATQTIEQIDDAPTTSGLIGHVPDAEKVARVRAQR